jgi:hypothetical protein
MSYRRRSNRRPRRLGRGNRPPAYRQPASKVGWVSDGKGGRRFSPWRFLVDSGQLAQGPGGRGPGKHFKPTAGQGGKRNRAIPGGAMYTTDPKTGRRQHIGLPPSYETPYEQRMSRRMQQVERDIIRNRRNTERNLARVVRVGPTQRAQRQRSGYQPRVSRAYGATRV